MLQTGERHPLQFVVRVVQEERMPQFMTKMHTRFYSNQGTKKMDIGTGPLKVYSSLVLHRLTKELEQFLYDMEIASDGTGGDQITSSYSASCSVRP